MKDRKEVAGGWFLTFLHSPVVALWIMLAIMTVAGVIELFHNPRQALEMFSGVALLATLTKFIARMKGMAPWPFLLDDDDDDDVPMPMIDAGELSPLEAPQAVEEMRVK